jgi:hypothetical protein
MKQKYHQISTIKSCECLNIHFDNSMFNLIRIISLIWVNRFKNKEMRLAQLHQN